MILVIGQARGGTSVAAGVLHRLGVSAGPGAGFDADEWNPLGSFADPDFRHLHLMIRHQGIAPHRAEYESLIAAREKETGGRWALKCHALLAVWEQVLPLLLDVRVVLCDRDPAESKDSLLARRGERQDGPGFCERYVAETRAQAAALAAAIPPKRVIRLHFDEVADPSEYVKKLAGFAALPVKKEAEDIVKPELRRFGGSTPQPTKLFMVEVTPEPPPAPCRHFVDTVQDRRGRGCTRCWVYGCEVFGTCVPGEKVEGVAHCDDCRHRRAEDDTPDVKVLELVNRLSPGDCLVMEAAIASLHAAHPGRFLTAVRTPVNSLFENHPHVHQISPLERSRPGLMMTIDMQYPAISQSDSRGIHFMQAYCEFLEQQIGVPVPLLVNAPRVYLSAQEKGWMSQVQELTGDGSPYVVVNAGRKADFTAKWAGTAFYQRVVDLLRPRVRCVQVGDQSHHHPPLAGVIDLRGKTDTRQLVRLTYHAAAGIGPSTFLQHLFAAHRKLYVCVAGGREPVQWLQYPMQTTLHSIGRYPCCRDRSCWRSRTVKLGDGAEQDGSVCSLPVVDAGGDAVPKCLADIRPEAAAEAILAVIGRV